jgi:hypothetical protein
MENNNRWQTIALARQNPTLAARTMLQRTDVAANWAGHVLAISRCHPVTPARVHIDGRYNGKCYSAPVAVMHDGTVMFVVLGTNDLQLYGMPVPCTIVYTVASNVVPDNVESTDRGVAVEVTRSFGSKHNYIIIGAMVIILVVAFVVIALLIYMTKAVSKMCRKTKTIDKIIIA